MTEFTHDPSEHIRGLQQLLISDKKKIAFLFGAGTSLSKKNKDSLFVPAMGDLTQSIETELSKEPKYKNAIDEIKKEIGTGKYNIETLLSNLEQKLSIIADGRLNKLTKTDIELLITDIKKQIREKVSVHKNLKKLEDIIQFDFAEWIGRADRKYPIEIFTTNYDYLFELGLEGKIIPYYDGFTGSFLPFFNSDSVEDLDFLPHQTKLWKVHGSLGWHFDKITQKVIRKDSSDEDILIYPSTFKYSDSKKQPYVSLLDRLSNYLKQDDVVLITCGYSFNDDHINERILTALNSNTKSYVVALYHDKDDKTKKYNLDESSPIVQKAKSNGKLSVYGYRSAVIGCQYGKWKLKTESDRTGTLSLNLYFSEDGDDRKIEKKVEKKGEETWTGEGELFLPDFTKFVAFLKSMIIENDLYLKEATK
ncbi:MAG: SIR2 family protein [Ignavibacteriales bacterium]|nr:SIR2 family protein [Ignavibacteriales bacterium]